MKTKIKSFLPTHLIFYIGLLWWMTSCTSKYETTETYYYYERVYGSPEEFKADIAFSPQPEVMKSPGRIYFKDDILFINEPEEGVHIIDNSDPSNPVILGFLTIPGNFDIAIKGQKLYADNYIDLVEFDLSDLSNIKETNRLNNLFENTYRDKTVDGKVWYKYKEVKEVKIKDGNIEDYETLRTRGWIDFEGGVLTDNVLATSVNTNKSASVGKAGSMARFAINSSYLYVLDNHYLDVVNINGVFEKISDVRIGWGTETISPYKNMLLFGTQTGMLIYDLYNPEAPNKLSEYNHITSCDPVAADKDIAYVTLRSGTTCRQGENLLEIIDLKDIKNPTLIASYPMTNPHGLAVENNTLFLCDGKDGLKIFDVRDAQSVDKKMLAHFGDIQAYDIILHKQVAMMIGKNGLYQYRYNNLQNIELISTINIVR